MNKFKLFLNTGFVVEHFGADLDAAKEYVENLYKKEVVKIFDVTFDNKGILVYIKKGWFGPDED